MKRLSSLLCVGLIAFGFATFAQADTINPFKDTYGYNTIVLNNFIQNGVNDVEGQLAVGGNMTANGSFGVNLAAGSRSAPAALYVGGHLRVEKDWEVKGNVYYGSGSSYRGAGNQWYTPPVTYIQSGSGSVLTNDPLDFGAMEESLRTSAATLSALQSTAGVSTSFNRIDTQISVGGGQQVVNIDLSTLYNGGSDLFNLKISGQSDTVLLVNLIGDGTTALNMYGGFELLGGLTANHLIFNFVDVASVNIHDMTIKANLLGVDTDLILAKGNIEGINVFNNATYNASGEAHSTNFFDGGFDIPITPVNPPASTPEPSTLAMIGIGSLLAGLYARRRKTETV